MVKVFLAAACLLALASPLLAYRQMIIFDKSSGKVIVFHSQGGFHSPDYQGRNDVMFDMDMGSLERTVPRKYWKVENGAVREMRQAEKDAVNAAEVVVITGP